MLNAIVTTGVVICIVFGLVKPLIEVAIPPKAALHDALLRIIVILIGAVVGIAQAALAGTVLDVHSAATALLGGASEGLSAIALYHLVPGDLFVPAPVPATTPPDAPPDQAPAPVPPTTAALIVPATAAIAPVAPIVAEA